MEKIVNIDASQRMDTSLNKLYKGTTKNVFGAKLVLTYRIKKGQFEIQITLLNKIRVRGRCRYLQR